MDLNLKGKIAMVPGSAIAEAVLGEAGLTCRNH